MGSQSSQEEFNFLGNFSSTTFSPEMEDDDAFYGNFSWAGNSSLSEEGDDDEGMEGISPHNVALAVLLSAFCAATVFGNALIVVAVARERYLHSVTNYFITSLAVADCLVGLVVMPFQAIFELMNKRWIFGEYWCDLWHSLDVLASTSSILNLCVISLDRYWAITDPFSYPSRMTTNRACFLIALVWFCSSLISFPAILWWRATRDQPIPPLKCPFTQDIGYLVFSSIISFYGPLFVMVFTYYRIYRAAVQQTRSLKMGSKLCTDGDVELTLRIHRGGRLANLNDQHHSSRSQPAAIHHPRNHHAPTHQNSDDCDSDIGHIDLEGGNGTSPPRSNSVRVVPKNLKHFSISRKLAKFSKEKKAAKTLSVVMGVFIVCWLPFFITNLISGFCRSCLQQAELVTDIATWLGWINSSMNPVIYASMSRDFRRAFGRVICACCSRRIKRPYRAGVTRSRLPRLTQSMTAAVQTAMVAATPRHPAATGSCSSASQDVVVPPTLRE
ncbi:dopamine receptor 2-like isoform X1 [Folsomia candida]|uniref:dopamine receptor 2-like isoform X1 n=1 Tax=Folsomia candida TaxID=158441 RepID=UPI00160509D9|nr:dopamine receptor 2-like isoform X1 [Folsomia candida]XP_035713326.1 dopamine receptor 2-like isoform X1 [Folsomia candida]XP_035713327.1 dopamine receptor 2-like isoform X1 [Folsomia candida]XP_035713328.1 dopamine receptor 2-like isoform X1 [Folsomia candida]